MTDIQNQVQEAIDELVESGAERGLQVAVYRHGEPVVDAVAGAADPAAGRPVTSDTPFFSYARTSPLAAPSPPVPWRACTPRYWARWTACA